MPKVSKDDDASGNLVYRPPRLAKKDLEFITCNLLEVDAKAEGERSTGKRQKKKANKVKQAVRRLKRKRNKTPAESRLLERVKKEHESYC